MDTRPMTSVELRKILKNNKDLYMRFPELNDILYVNDSGWTSMQELHEFVNLKTLHAEGNCISAISGLEKLVELRELFLARNRLLDISNLKFGQNLTCLDLSSNNLVDIGVISHLTRLKSLDLSANQIESLFGLDNCVDLRILNLERNRLTTVSLSLKNLKCLYIQDNPISKPRNEIILQFPELTYLSDQAVTDRTRSLAEAFLKGGAEAETQLREVYRDQDVTEWERLRTAPLSKQSSDNTARTDSTADSTRTNSTAT